MKVHWVASSFEEKVKPQYSTVRMGNRGKPKDKREVSAAAGLKAKEIESQLSPSPPLSFFLSLSPSPSPPPLLSICSVSLAIHWAGRAESESSFLAAVFV